MLKLMKYEFRKQALSKGVILALVVLIELVFAFGMIFDHESFINGSVICLFITSMASFFYVSYEAIITFSKDLKEKCSYMLFLTPHSAYTIIGAKVVSAAIQVLLVGIAFFGVAAIDILALAAKYDSFAEIQRFILRFLSEIANSEIKSSDIFIVLILILFSWISVITVAFFSISLSTTFLANKKYKGILSFAIFVALNLLFSYIVKITIGDVDTYLQSTFILETVYYIVFTILGYVGTGYVLDKKVSVWLKIISRMNIVYIVLDSITVI